MQMLSPIRSSGTAEYFYTNISTRWPLHLKQDKWLAHRTLNDQASNILPPLLQQTDQEIDCKHDISDQFIISHRDISNCNTKTEDL
jgi:hypothetical protein